MANRNTAGFGLIPTGTVGATPATGGQGKYFIDAAYDKNLYQNSAVQSKVGYIKTGQAAITNATIGVLNGIFYNAATTLKPTFSNHYAQPITPANSEDITAFVHDNPLQLFIGVLDAAAAQADYGRTVGVTVDDGNGNVGNSSTGTSTATLTDATIHDSNNAFRLLRSAEDPENDENAANRSVIVCQNLNQYIDGGSWQ